jgi:diguanylate cyclase (GGDEF)-like protein
MISAVKRRGWGLAVFLFSPLLIGVVLYITIYSTTPASSRLYSVIPFPGFILSLICILTGHLSYPRVHNPKVFLGCYLTGFIGIVHFLPSMLGFSTRPPLPLLLFLLQMNLLIILLMPSSVKYRVAKLFTFLMITGELSLVGLIMLRGSLIPVLGSYGMNMGMPEWITVLWPVLILVLSFLMAKREFHLGGVITGQSYFHAVSLLALLRETRIPGTVNLLLMSSMFYLVIGVLIHCFSRMENRVTYDPLLQIFNRNYCSRIIAEQSKLNTSPPFGIAMVDIDHFKKVNDKWGHQAGDCVLIHVAQTIQEEITPDGILCRYGGEELAVFFPKKESRDIHPLMENVRRSVEALKVSISSRKSVSVTISCGISHRSSSSQSIADVLKRADRALYRAKGAGRNRVVNTQSASERE